MTVSFPTWRRMWPIPLDRPLLGYCPDEPPLGLVQVIWWDTGRGCWINDCDRQVRPVLWMERPPLPVGYKVGRPE